MNILIVDDQKQVVDGILAGVHWRNLPQIQNVCPAYTAAQAKHILTNFTIDIIVSDIEMPGENGIELIRWVGEQFPDIKCIFLTAHANFDYAQDAIRLNCEDYILQPVKYEVLEASIAKTINGLAAAQKDRRLMNDNTFWNMHSAELKQQIWLDFMHKGTEDINAMLDKLQKLDPTQPLDGQYTLLIIQEVQAVQPLENLTENKTIQFLATYTQGFFAQTATWQYLPEITDHQCIYIFSSELKADELYNITQTFLDLCKNNYDIPLAIYMAPAIALRAIPEACKKLEQLRNGNIGAYSRLFTFDEPDIPALSSLPSTQNWSDYFVNNTTDLIMDSIRAFVDRSCQSGTLNAVSLLSLQQCFIHAFYNSLQIRAIRFRTIMDKPEVFEALSVSTRSLNDFFHFTDIIIQTNKDIQPTSKADSDNLIELAQKYILDHIDGDLSRQTIAQNIHISDSYLSHLFLNQLNISLTDYITSQRMQLARSMLSGSNMPIQLIAQKTGYSHLSYFIKIFKREFGLTPAEYRKSH